MSRRRERERRRSRSRSRSRDRSGGRSRGRSRDRGRSRGRSRDRSRGRSRVKSRERSRERSRSRGRRSRSRSRSGKRSKRRRKSRSRSRSRSRSPRSDSDSERYRRRRRAPNYSEPSSSVMVRGLGSTVTSETLKVSISELLGLRTDLVPSDIRVIGDHSTGESRGFGFVEFESVESAVEFLKLYHDKLIVNNRTMHMDFSHGQTKYSDKRHARMRQDWMCPSCGGHNFARRTACFQCGVEKGDDALNVEDSSFNSREAETTAPSSVLIVQDLHPDTSADTIRYSFAPMAVVKDVRLVRDKKSDISRGFAFVEFSSIEDATLVVQSSVGLRVDDTPVRVTFSKVSGNGSVRGKKRGKNAPPDRPAQISAGFEWDAKSGYWYDEATGFYYDQTTQLYYHGLTGIYYRWDADNGKYIQVDDRGVPLENLDKEAKRIEKEKKDAKAAAVPVSAVKPSNVVIKKKKKKKVKATGMFANMKLGQAFNQGQPQTVFSGKPTVISSGPVFSMAAKPSIPVNVTINHKAIEIMNRGSKSNLCAADTLASSAVLTTITTAMPTTPKIPHAAPVSRLSISRPEQKAEKPVNTKWLNYDRKACLLCKRQFKTHEQLKKHAGKSALHKKNLEVESYKDMHARQRKEAGLLQRSREAKQRSAIKKRQFEDMVQQAAERKAKKTVDTPIEASNKGSKMLAAMGWKKGQGLGKKNTGIVNPVQAQILKKGAGVGHANTNLFAGITAADNYSSVAQKKTQARYSSSAQSKPSAVKSDAMSEYMRMMNQHNKASCGTGRDNRPLMK